jgi:hypothetical protein
MLRNEAETTIARLCLDEDSIVNIEFMEDALSRLLASFLLDLVNQTFLSIFLKAEVWRKDECWIIMLIQKK